MGNKNHNKAIESFLKQIAKHQEKIKLELEKDFPDLGLIKHWEKEVRTFEENIQKKLKRLGQ
ncbi:hypothetical protein H6G54_16795 [Anabaena cylindrica FACHB-243]|uniref:Uncharacterized protein n=1 Tax=Anabaena cylindrica (strain ATCC 27899 / PCC 7122) TaxID=272123 RepID=K9ZF05_ANACC|nr:MULTISPECIES: hypothetical protein [Anabaena]AFZ57761.1 hypothetical protein Anacy_2305 [Anabaena cylindrica PCC 7122]MBD2419329.1 hypothetical protein [Anabaena cylindrica FACHB-243]MBY5282165.1 hypothetical protein [Anabaena sp. CCAP 1446/1C]MBY5307937.1 hypothetical protein [Anabaena sp. CCAP 1446/1C]MCM2409145.1 hypothetical protein [Anabaena sp. CCAP 1446/1C]